MGASLGGNANLVWGNTRRVREDGGGRRKEGMEGRGVRKGQDSADLKKWLEGLSRQKRRPALPGEWICCPKGCGLWSF